MGEIMSKWSKGMKILIDSQTGSGKSFFVQNTIYDYCKMNDMKCLLLSNRNLLREQNRKHLSNKEDVFTIRNYQDLETKVVNGMEFDELVQKFEFIVFDECHAPFADSFFNCRTDSLLKGFTDEYPDKIILFLTATPQNLIFFYESIGKEFDLNYPSDIDYSYVEKLRMFGKKDSVESILQNLDYTEKAIYFSNTTKEAYAMSMFKFDDSAFICAEGNKEHGRDSNKEVVRQIAENDSFEPKILCTTKVLDNGVNIVDSEVKTIIIESSDPINIIQSLGRKRITGENEKIKVYIKDVPYHILKKKKEAMEKIVETALFLREKGKEEFQQHYRKSSFDSVVDNAGGENPAKFYAAAYMIMVYKEMMKLGFERYIKKLLNYSDEIKSSDEEFKKKSFLEIIESYSGRKLFEEERMEFRRKLINFVYMPKKRINYKRMGMGIINSHLESFNIPYYVISRQETSGERRKDTYWILSQIPDFVSEEENLEKE